MQAASARRCFQPPDSVPASWCWRLVEAETLERRVDGAAEVRQSVEPRDEFEVLADRQVLVEGEALRHVADVALDLLRLASGCRSRGRCPAAVGPEQPADHADRRRLAGAVRPEEADDLAFATLEVDVVDDRLVAEALGQPVHVDDRCAAAAFMTRPRSVGATSTGWPSGRPGRRARRASPRRGRRACRGCRG